MLSSVPLPRLLEGVAASLREHVAPHVDDRFAQMQLRAIDELLRNLAVRTEWREADVTEDLSEIADLLAVLRTAGWDADGASTAPGAEAPVGVEAALARRAWDLDVLREAIAWVLEQDGDDPRVVAARAAAIARLRTANGRSRELLLSGMYA